MTISWTPGKPALSCRWPDPTAIRRCMISACFWATDIRMSRTWSPITGNDFQTLEKLHRQRTGPEPDGGNRSADTHHLQTTELDYHASGSLDNPLLTPLTGLSSVFDYYCSYGQTLSQYNQAKPVPGIFSGRILRIQQLDSGQCHHGRKPPYAGVVGHWRYPRRPVLRQRASLYLRQRLADLSGYRRHGSVRISANTVALDKMVQPDS